MMNIFKNFFREVYKEVRIDLDSLMVMLNMMSNRVQKIDDTLTRVEKAVKKDTTKKVVKSSKKK